MTLDARGDDTDFDALDRTVPASFGRRHEAGGPADAASPPTPTNEIEDADAEPVGKAPRGRKGRRSGRSGSARRPTVVFLNFLMSVAVFGALVAVIGLQVAKSYYDGTGPLAADTTFEVREGATLSSVARDLENRGIIAGVGPLAGADLFKAGARLSGNDTAIKTGEFAIPAGSSMAFVLNELVNGSPVEFRVTIPEGLTVWQASQRIQAHPDLVGDLPNPLPPEGMLAAETVTFPRGATRASIIQKLHDLQKRRVAAAWENRSPDAPVESPTELLTLASIIEKETALAEERGLVAGVFTNRVRENWHLNTDPTLIYGVFGGKGLPEGRPILQSDKEDRNPYNTYIFRGLPPGPIAIPGKASLDAAANPADTDAMFFVADGTGGHTFSASMADHNDAVADLRRRERERRAAADQSPVAGTAAPPASEPAASPEVVEAETQVVNPDAPLAAPEPPGFVQNGQPAPGIPVPLMRPGG